jgi:Tfp pilus tip-associated adhesin PilY1
MPTIKYLIAVLLTILMLTGLGASRGSAYVTSLPPFVQVGMEANVLIILDNSNSMDEDFNGNAAGSYNPISKSVNARVALQNMVTSNATALRAGLMTFALPTSGVGSYLIYNSPYFASYDPQSYCPNTEVNSACVTYCQTGNSSARNACLTGCQNGDLSATPPIPPNPSFNPDYFDAIITNYPIGSEPRNRYCNLVYPKAQAMVNPTDTSNFIFYKNAYPFYDGGYDGTQFCESALPPNGPGSYSATDGPPWNNYQCYYTKTGSSDLFSGYSNPGMYGGFMPTDSDYANGYYNFGQRMTWNYVGPAWFSGSSPGGGSLRVPINYLTDSSGNNTVTQTSLMNELIPYTNNSAGYMSCSGDPNNCSYIINAGNTPTRGTLANAINYFQGTLGSNPSPILAPCQQNFIVLVTDGMPDTRPDGSLYSAAEVSAGLPLTDVVTQINALQNLSYNGNTYQVKVYVLGVGSEALGNLDAMAQAGGTADANGHAYYASNAAELQQALSQIFSSIVVNEGTAGAVATVSQQAAVGDLIVRGSFKAFSPTAPDPKPLIWQGHLESYWECPSCSTLTSQTACQGNTSCTCAWTDNHCVGQYAFQSGPANPTDTNPTFCADFKDTTCWDAGTLLTSSSQSSRNIFTYINGTQTPFTTANATTLAPYLQNTIDFVVASCTSYSNSSSCNAVSGCGWNSSTSKCAAVANSTDVPDLISWIRGDTTFDGTTARNRSGWILGDIVYSTPVVVQAPALAYIPASAFGSPTPPIFGNCAASASTDPCVNGCTSSSNCATQCFQCYQETHQYRKQMAYVGGNDGMLHAFVIGKWENNQWVYSNASDSEIGTEKWAYIPGNLLPSLQQLAMCSYGTTCNGVAGPKHRYMVDLSPQPREVYISVNGGARQWRTVLVGGEREGGDVYFAIDVTDPDNPSVLWEYSMLRNMVQMVASGGSYTATYPFLPSTTYAGVETMPITYCQPSIGTLNLPTGALGVSFVTANQTFGPTTPTPSVIPPSTTTVSGSTLSGWVTFIGMGMRAFSANDWPAGITYAQQSIASKPYLAAIDMETGVNLFQYLWPTLQIGNFETAANCPTYSTQASCNAVNGCGWNTSPVGCESCGSFVTSSSCTSGGKCSWNASTGQCFPNASPGTTASEEWQDVDSGSYHIPYSVTGTAAIDLNGDGYTERVYFGDLNGEFYSLKFNFTSSPYGMKMDIWPTQAISGNSIDNYRSNREPITAVPTLAFDSVTNNIEAYFGTGKYDNVVGADDDKTDTASMSFYEVHDPTATGNEIGVPVLSSACAVSIGNTVTLAGCDPLGSSGSGAGLKANNFNVNTTFHSPLAPSYSLTRPGERVLDPALVAGADVIFTTFIPAATACSAGGESYLDIFGMDFGNMNTDPFTDSGMTHVVSVSSLSSGSYAQTTGTNSSTHQAVTGYVADLGGGMPSQPILDSNAQDVFVQTSNAQIHEVRIDIGSPLAFRGWKEEPKINQ